MIGRLSFERSLLPVAVGYGVAKLPVSKVSLLIMVPDRE